MAAVAAVERRRRDQGLDRRDDGGVGLVGPDPIVVIGVGPIAPMTGRHVVPVQLTVAVARQGLDHAKALRLALDAVIAVLEGEKALPGKAAPQVRAKTTKAPNPFA